MSNDILIYLIIGVVAIFVVVVIAYLILRKKMEASGYREIQQLRSGTQSKTF